MYIIRGLGLGACLNKMAGCIAISQGVQSWSSRRAGGNVSRVGSWCSGFRYLEILILNMISLRALFVRTHAMFCFSTSRYNP